MNFNSEELHIKSQNLTSSIETFSVEEIFYLFSESNVPLKLAVSLSIPEVLEAGESKVYLFGFSTFYKMELEIFLKDLSSKCYLLN